tara:strand:+ start:11469 stop:14468 length:3000 start_codon:yes stop_codon:yes gene_type:complete
MPSEASNMNSSIVPAGAGATNIGKKTIAISKSSFGELNQTGDLINGYPIFSSVYDSSDRLRFLFDATWSVINEDDTQQLVFQHPGGPYYAKDRFLVDWFNSFSEAQIFPLGMPDTAKSVDLAGNLHTDFMHLKFGSYLDIEPDKTVVQDPVVDDEYTFDFTKQEKETMRVHVSLVHLNDSFDSNLMKSRFESLFVDGTYSYYNSSLSKVATGAELKSIVNFDTWFFDYSFKYDRAFTNTELNNLNSLPGALHANIDVHYSPDFNFDEYRQTISDKSISEKALPMYYAFPEIAGYNDNEQSPPGMFSGLPEFYQLVFRDIFKESIKLNAGQVFAQEYQEVTGMDTNYATLNNLYNGNTIKGDDGIDHQLAGSSDKELYYKLYSARTEQFLAGTSSPGPIHDKIASKYTNICLTDSRKDLLKEFDSVRSQHPMSVGISFNTNKKKNIANVLNQTSMMAPVMANVAYTLPEAVITPFTELTEETTETQKKHTIADSDRRSWDLNNIIKKYTENPGDVFSLQNQEVTTFVSNNEIDFINPQDSLLKFLFSTVANAKIVELLDQESRDYEQIMKGEKNEESEILFYRIEKSSNGNTIQNILVPNMAEQSVINILDTQVKYDKYYEYRVYAYHAVPGTMYKYTGPVEYYYSWDTDEVSDPPPDGAPVPDCDEDSSNTPVDCSTSAAGIEEEFGMPVPELIEPAGNIYMQASFNILTQSSLRLIEVPYFNVLDTKPTIVLDRPPVPPDVNIVPFSGIHNKIFIMLNASVGDYTLDPISLALEDGEQFSKIRDSQGLGSDDPINFQTDDANVSYQIFRTATAPLSYDDFQIEEPINIEKTSYIDTISPNQKYYYTFRAIDENGHMSNPTGVFEVELVTLEDGSDVSKAAILPLIKEYTFPEAIDSYATRDFRKYLLIKPALGQDELDYNNSNIISADEQKNPNLISPNFGVKQKKIFSSESGEYNPSEGTWTEPSGSVPRYKLRVTSKKTGRKIDINFKFTNKQRQQ